MKPRNWRNSRAYWEKLVEVYSAMLRERRRSYIFVPLAEAQWRIGEADKAIETLEDGLALMPNSRAGMVMLARIKNDTGDVSGAKRILEEVVGRWPDVPAAVLMLSRIYENEGNFDAAREISGRLLDYFPDADPVKEAAERFAPLEENTNGAETETTRAGDEVTEVELSITTSLIEEAFADAERKIAEAAAAMKDSEEKEITEEHDGKEEEPPPAPYEENDNFSLTVRKEEEDESPVTTAGVNGIDAGKTGLSSLDIEEGEASQETREDEDRQQKLFTLESMLSRIYHLKKTEHNE